jgi:ABC-type Zn uptake system ZnuABC Zn-binding protein ZnuA
VRAVRRFLAPLALSAALAGPAWGAPDRPAALPVAATTTDLKALVEEVGGDRVEVHSLANAVHDPHAIEIKPGQIAWLKRSALLVRIGLDHEPWLARAVAAAGEPRLAPGGEGDLDASKGIALLQSETPRLRADRRAHVHAFGNPHYWLDPENGRPITAAILERLSRLRPEERAVFAANRERFLARLDSGLARWQRALAPYRGARTVVVHESWPYFAERFGIVVVAAIEPTPGVPATPASLAELARRMKASGVRLIIAEPYSDASPVRQVAGRSGAQVVTLIPSVSADPAAGDYLALFDLNVKRLADALAPN